MFAFDSVLFPTGLNFSQKKSFMISPYKNMPHAIFPTFVLSISAAGTGPGISEVLSKNLSSE